MEYCGCCIHDGMIKTADYCNACENGSMFENVLLAERDTLKVENARLMEALGRVDKLSHTAMDGGASGRKDVMQKLLDISTKALKEADNG